MLDVGHGLGVHASVSKQKSKSERAARGKIAVPPSDFLTDPAHAPPFPPPDTTPLISPSSPSANGEEEADLARLADDGGPPSPPTEAIIEREAGAAPESPTALSLEQRVQHLEEVVRWLQDRRPSQPRPAPSPIALTPPPTAVQLDVNKRPQAPAAPVATAVPVSMPGIVHSVTRGSVMWLLWDTWAEARAIVRMFVDPRYPLPWSARALPLVLLAAILTSRYWVPFASIPFLGDWLLVKLVDLLLAFLLFKWLGHEARRYRQTSPDLPANLRL
jgi:hypothetical protein